MFSKKLCEVRVNDRMYHAYLVQNLRGLYQRKSPNSLDSYVRIRYIRFLFCVITVAVISNSVMLVSIISDSYLVISDMLYLIPLYQDPLYQIHCGLRACSLTSFR